MDGKAEYKKEAKVEKVEDISEMIPEVTTPVIGNVPVVKLYLETFGDITLEDYTLSKAVHDLKACEAENSGFTIWRNGKAEMYIPAWSLHRVTWVANAYPIEESKPGVIVPPRGTKFD